MGIPIEYCEPWTTSDRLCCPDAVYTDCVTDEIVATTYAWTDEELINAATGMLFRLTCGLFPGYCTITIRPCPDCRCGKTRCSCGQYRFISLQDRYPVISVDQVLINGVALDPAAYRVDDYQRLVRIDGECWPRCNDLSLPDSEANTFSVTYTAGRRPPIELQMAAAELACELKRACAGVECRLPANVTRVSRQGVTLDLQSAEAAAAAGVSGIAIVDAAVRRYNCARASARVWHPSLSSPGGVYPS